MDGFGKKKSARERKKPSIGITGISMEELNTRK
jgi:hypothetical protein